MTEFETKIYELNYERNRHAHDLRWKFMYSYVAGSLAFWGLIYSASATHQIPRAPLYLPLLFALFGWASYHALRENMIDRGKVMLRLEEKAGVWGWQTMRKEKGRKEHQKPLVFFAHIFWGGMALVSFLLATLVRP